jgi:hypothetical protein
MSPLSVFRRFWRISAITLFTIIVIAAIAANIHPIIAATVAYVSAFISGTLDPFWPHVGLLSVSVTASIAVGAGIIFEGQKYSAAIHRVAFWLVVVGIVFEAVCTIFLFVFDEGISSAQKLKIATLEARIAPRLLKQSEQNELTAKLVGTEKQVGTVTASPSLPESEWFARVLTAPLKAAGWDMTVVPGSPLPTILQPTGVVIEYHIELNGMPQTRPQTVEAANRLAAALKDVGIDATAVPGIVPSPMTMQIVITPK